MAEDRSLWSSGSFFLLLFYTRWFGWSVLLSALPGLFMLPAATFIVAPGCFAQYRIALSPSHVTPLLEHHSHALKKKKRWRKKQKKQSVFSTRLMGGGRRVHIVQLDFCFVTRLLCALFVALGWMSDMPAEVLAQLNQCHQQIPTIANFICYFVFHLALSEELCWCNVQN